MKKHRPVILMIVMLGMLLFYFYQNYLGQSEPKKIYFSPDGTVSQEVLAGENEIYNVNIVRDEAGFLQVQVDYYFTGAPSYALISAELNIPNASNRIIFFKSELAKIGKNSAHLEIQNPRFFDDSLTTTHEIVICLRKNNVAHLKKSVPYDAEWISPQESLWKQKIANSSLDQLYKESVDLIDRGSRESIDTAETYLNQIIVKDSNFAPAYLELARIAMKNSWDEEGLFRAEKNILSSLKINSTNPNAKVLLGYVYTHQKKYKQAEENFVDAEKIGTNNLWLWANWGELYSIQNKQKDAIGKYMRAIDGVRPFNTYDRARLDAYRNLFNLLKIEISKDQLDALYKKRADEFSSSPCFNVDYGKFKLVAYGDYESATSLTQKAIDSGCTDQKAKNTLGVAYYHSWIATEAAGDIAKARAFYPEGAALFYELIKNPKGVKIIKKLVDGGTPLDVKDREGRTALALALFAQDSINANQLIQLGASVNILLGEEKFPISFIPLIYGDEKSIALMTTNGIDYRKVKFNGVDGIGFSQYYRNSQSLESGKKI